MQQSQYCRQLWEISNQVLETFWEVSWWVYKPHYLLKIKSYLGVGNTCKINLIRFQVLWTWYQNTFDMILNVIFKLAWCSLIMCMLQLLIQYLITEVKNTLWSTDLQLISFVNEWHQCSLLILGLTTLMLLLQQKVTWLQESKFRFLRKVLDA